MTTTHAARTYSLTRIEVGDNLVDDLRDRGLDGMFYRRNCGEYVHVVTA